ncbi:MAG: hypothetical protein ACLFTH_02610 [Candidatus Woesearchaeota archaeon]
MSIDKDVREYIHPGVEYFHLDTGEERKVVKFNGEHKIPYNGKTMLVIETMIDGRKAAVIPGFVAEENYQCRRTQDLLNRDISLVEPIPVHEQRDATNVLAQYGFRREIYWNTN